MVRATKYAHFGGWEDKGCDLLYKVMKQGEKR
jgi:hypothetical protein